MLLRCAPPPSLPVANYDIIFCLAFWYTISLGALWANKYLVYTMGVDTSILSLVQLGMSVICGVAVEIRAVGTTAFVSELQTSFAVVAKGDNSTRLKDMLSLGFVRILNLLFDLVALKYIPVSLAQIVKSSAPFFTVLLTYLVLGKATSCAVTSTLLPVVVGLVCCSLSIMGAATAVSTVGLVAAISANCADCLQNVLSKKFLNSAAYTVTQLQLYSSLVATVLQVSFVGYQNVVAGSGTHLAWRRTDNHHAATSSELLVVCVLLNGVAYYVQSALAYRVMSQLSPVSHSVASTLKRALLIVLSILRYGESITLLHGVGIALVLGGVFCFSRASKARVAPSPSLTQEGSAESDPATPKRMMMHVMEPTIEVV
ncbi:Aste57867_20680 [Aphanomyces stellatus]|uniref:Aste57867_20680 protein n=1 Tax=Aphanomyces stellatus TaxID=120398 RepID=A0A485LK91_9STRA|nr:hypothetical protein As57867_020612 [Aphanomyces stellatus]VFT97360.1 Aste57867_20680 [Aphanomyces stellatus]